MVQGCRGLLPHPQGDQAVRASFPCGRIPTERAAASCGLSAGGQRRPGSLPSCETSPDRARWTLPTGICGTVSTTSGPARGREAFLYQKTPLHLGEWGPAGIKFGAGPVPGEDIPRPEEAPHEPRQTQSTNARCAWQYPPEHESEFPPSVRELSVQGGMLPDGPEAAISEVRRGPIRKPPDSTPRFAQRRPDPSSSPPLEVKEGVVYPSGLCHFHTRFKDAARSCVRGCRWQGNAPGAE